MDDTDPTETVIVQLKTLCRPSQLVLDFLSVQVEALPSSHFQLHLILSATITAHNKLNLLNKTDDLHKLAASEKLSKLA